MPLEPASARSGGEPGDQLVVVVVAGTQTRIRQLEKLVNVDRMVVGGGARDAATAEQLVEEIRPSAVLVDLDLFAGGLEVVESIMAQRPTPIVVCGSAAEHPEAALAAGAVDVVGALDVRPGSPEYGVLLRRHLSMASRVRVITHPRARLRSRRAAANGSSQANGSANGSHGSNGSNGSSPQSAELEAKVDAALGRLGANPARQRTLVVAIGASTGGPPALATILGDLPSDLPAAVVVVQHMAEGFVEGLARWLDSVSPLPVVVAVDGERLAAGTVYLAPAGLNLTVRHGMRVGLSEPPPQQYHVPGVDVTFRSVAEISGSNSVGVLLTGMGRDGAAGLRQLRDVGAFTIGQDEETSVVWGMPAAAQQLDAVSVELPLPKIARSLVRAVDRLAPARLPQEEVAP